MLDCVEGLNRPVVQVVAQALTLHMRSLQGVASLLQF